MSGTDAEGTEPIILRFHSDMTGRRHNVLIIGRLCGKFKIENKLEFGDVVL